MLQNEALQAAETDKTLLQENLRSSTNEVARMVITDALNVAQKLYLKQALQVELIAAIRQSLTHVISDVSSCNVELQVQVQAEKASEVVIDSAVNNVLELDNTISPLEGMLAPIFSDRLSGKRNNCQLERSNWFQRQLVLELKQVVLESEQTAVVALEECAGLTEQVRRLLSEKATLEDQVKANCFLPY